MRNESRWSSDDGGENCSWKSNNSSREGNKMGNVLESDNALTLYLQPQSSSPKRFSQFSFLKNWVGHLGKNIQFFWFIKFEFLQI